MNLRTMDVSALTDLERQLSSQYAELIATRLNLDLTRGKPAIEQLQLSAALDGAIEGDFHSENGTDTRGYGGLDGIAEARRLAGNWLGVPPESTIVGGNSSLSLMYLFMLGAHRFGLNGANSAWANDLTGTRFLCPVPGYDRHFSICEDLGIEMIPVPMTGAGPDMDTVEQHIKADPGIKGMWCVPKHSNPSGESYSDGTVRRIAALGQSATPEFRVMWDNAYALHDLDDSAALQNVMDCARELGTEDNVVLFGSTSKVTFAGAGLSFIGGSANNIAFFRQRIAVMTVGPDKVNQLRHTRMLRDMDTVQALMRRHAKILKPKFDCVQLHLNQSLGNTDMGHWTIPSGGYFISFYAKPGCAREIVRLANEAGVKLTPAGAAYPYGNDPDDSHIRLAPSFPARAEVDVAMAAFVICVQLATVRSVLTQHH